jgi:hypothetical protein
MAKNEKGFCVFYDWVDDLDYLDPADAWVIVKAIKRYYQDGTSPVESVEGHLKAVASMIYNQIKRSESISNARAEAGRNGAAAKGETKPDVCQDLPKQKLANDSKNDICQDLPKQKEATETETETETYSFSQSTPARTCEVYADEKQMRERMRVERWGHVVVSDDQFSDLCEKLSLDELHHYMDVVEQCEVNGKSYTSKTHYRAILEMAEKDRKIESPPIRPSPGGGVYGDESLYAGFMAGMMEAASCNG